MMVGKKMVGAAAKIAAKTVVVPHGNPRFEYSRITPRIFLGTDMCCNPHFKSELLRRGVRADISLREKHIDSPFGVNYFLWLPTKDKQAPTQKQLLVGATTIDVLVQQKVNVYVHCKAGHGRSPTLVAAYFILKGKTALQAVAAVRKQRPGIHPTARQAKALRRFEEMVGRKAND